MSSRTAAFSLLRQLALSTRSVKSTFNASRCPHFIPKKAYYHATTRLHFQPTKSLHEAFHVPKPNDKSAPTRPPQPSYDITFTCKPCSARSTHRISKQGYHKGSVLITCPDCKNRHVISDHLKIFGDRNMTIEDLMRDRGQLVKKGTLSDDGDLEFWDSGEVTKRRNGEEEIASKDGVSDVSSGGGKA